MPKKTKLTLGLALLALAFAVGWPIASSELAYFELRADLRDIASQNAVRIGLASANTDDEIRAAVVRDARKYEIPLKPDQVTLKHTGTAEEPALYLAASYDVRIKLPGYSFTLHFAPSSAR
ncbi:MAG TPA: hypothetical protein VJO16_09965 [Candidatus Acidoferrum sp.]|nr:hypothetical protein [Candidatus Acidoferrum sp.]